MSPMLGYILVFAVGVVVLVAGGELLVRGAVSLADRLGVKPVVIGLTVVAFGTSAPELALNLVAALRGNSALCFGNIVGSNIANIGLILGLCALIQPLKVATSVIRRELPLMLVASGLVVAFLLLPTGEGAFGAGALSALEGSVLLGFFVATLWMIFRGARREGKVAPFEAEVREMEAAVKQAKFAGPVGLVVVGLSGLVVGGRLSELGAAGLARSLGVSDEVIGLTIVAIATSLPELVTSFLSVRRGHVDLAVGNVVGSNIFNLLFVLALTSLVRPIDMPPGGRVELVVMAALALLLWPMSRTHGSTVSRLEGLTLLAVYVGLMAWTVWRAMPGGAA
ncbi:MAG: calcium/sodium antiporter [Phycisphaerales bacterium]|nr:calcium/sodium antiporter [Phycisphaerales bacterium]